MESEKQSFKKWLISYPTHKYTDATITRYIRALEKSEEWLGINLPKKYWKSRRYMILMT